jgi:hypothetical protein
MNRLVFFLDALFSAPESMSQQRQAALPGFKAPFNASDIPFVHKTLLIYPLATLLVTANLMLVNPKASRESQGYLCRKLATLQRPSQVLELVAQILRAQPRWQLVTLEE